MGGSTKKIIWGKLHVWRVQDPQISNGKIWDHNIPWLTIQDFVNPEGQILVMIKGSTIKDLNAPIMQFGGNICFGWGNPLI